MSSGMWGLGRCTLPSDLPKARDSVSDMASRNRYRESAP